MFNDESPQLRNLACDLSCNNWSNAAEVAARIGEPWYAAQAYAWCGRYAPEPALNMLIQKSFRSARSGKDAYQQLGATAWPLRALIERGRPEQAAEEFGRVARIAAEVEAAGSRAEACMLGFEAVAVGPRELAERAFRWLLEHTQPATHWRQERAIGDASLELIELGYCEVGSLPLMINDERIASRTVARYARGRRREPRPFFWARGASGKA